MSKPVKHAPKHRAGSARSARGFTGRAVRTTVTLASAAAVTAATVAAGVAGAPDQTSAASPPAAEASLLTASLAGVEPLPPASQLFEVDAGQAAGGRSDVDEVREIQISERADVVSRSARRDATRTRRQNARGRGATTKVGRRQAAVSAAASLADDDPRDIARALLGSYGFSTDQFGCLDSLWAKESGWDVYADNPTSSAYGIPQALPGSKMASAGADWADNPATQIRWGLGYIRDVYGSPCAAWDHSQAMNWY